MALDPYGYPTEYAPEPNGRWWGTAIGLAGLCFAGAICCMGGDLLLMQTTDDVGLDWVGVALLLSFPMWPLLGIGLTTLTMYGATRRGWTLLGPNVLIGGALGVGLWILIFLGTIFTKVATEGPVSVPLSEGREEHLGVHLGERRDLGDAVVRHA